ncbi:MAG TPA: HAMP domain-containing sensor histidine kinase [Candidatus Acidoferrum sp.]|nr:HAMP domain-containing sensor histidine kinase [Candidatus Acidoferrum sp.]
MTATQTHDIRRVSIRVALAATGLVAVAYFIVAVAVVAIVTGNLTAQIDQRLTSAVAHVPDEHFQSGGHYEVPPPVHPGDQYGPQVLNWTIHADGTVFTATSNPALPAALERVAGPQTVTINGVDMRIVGAAAGDDYVVVAQTLNSVSQAQSTVITAELVIGPALLLVVFLGAVAIGRRVASPIDRARVRQLEFTADASHELRTPLSVIEAETTLALGRDRDAEWYQAAFRRVDGESKRMRRLLDDLLWLARFDATRGSPDAAPVDLGVLAGATVDRFRSVAEARRLTLDIDVPPTGAVITAPPEWLDRLLGVLLDNACKYSPADGTIRVSVARDTGRLRLTVDDSGPGIPANERDRIFDRFHRATDSSGGAGLGLAIADSIVRATGGRWRIGESPSGGASMSVAWQVGGSAPRGADKPARAEGIDAV